MDKQLNSTDNMPEGRLNSFGNKPNDNSDLVFIPTNSDLVFAPSSDVMPWHNIPWVHVVHYNDQVTHYPQPQLQHIVSKRSQALIEHERQHAAIHLYLNPRNNKACDHPINQQLQENNNE